MPSSAYQRFLDSMVMDFEKWHDGIGYDVDALDELSDEERASVERHILSKGVSDWRDLEALERLGTPDAIMAIVEARKSESHELRLSAHKYGPNPTDNEKSSAIVAALKSAEPFAGLSQVIDQAVSHPTAAVVAALWECVIARPGACAYHAASALCVIKGKTKSQYDDRYRPLFLRLVEAHSEDRRSAVEELKSLLGES